MNIDRLLRESNPPTGQLASPGPQYLNPETGQPEVVQGRYGAPFAMLLGPDGHPISNSNRLPVADQAAVDKLEQVRALLGDTDFATQATLAQVLTRLEALEERLDTGNAKVTLTGQIVAKSTDPKPPGKNGDILIWWDTKQVWLHDGTDWREW